MAQSQKNYGVRHSVRAGSSPRRRHRLPPPTYAHTILLGRKIIRRATNYAAAEQLSRAGAGGPKIRKKKSENCRTVPNIPYPISLYIEPNYTLSSYIEPNYTLSLNTEPNYTLS